MSGGDLIMVRYFRKPENSYNFVGERNFNKN
jgi:hypothetical protein